MRKGHCLINCTGDCHIRWRAEGVLLSGLPGTPSLKLLVLKVSHGQHAVVSPIVCHKIGRVMQIRGNSAGLVQARKHFQSQFGCDWFPLPHKSAAPAVPEFSISGEMDLHRTLPTKGDNLTEQIAFATSVELLINRAPKPCLTLPVWFTVVHGLLRNTFVNSPQAHSYQTSVL